MHYLRTQSLCQTQRHLHDWTAREQYLRSWDLHGAPIRCLPLCLELNVENRHGGSLTLMQE